MSYLRLSHRQNKYHKFTLTTSREKVRGKYFSFRIYEWNAFRFQIVAILFCIVWCGLWCRSAYIQLWKGTFFSEKARRQHIALETVSTPRGNIVDRNGRILAKSIQCYSVYADPFSIKDIESTTRKLSNCLHLSEETIRKLLQKKNRFVWISRHIDDATAIAINQMKIPGVMLLKEYERVYPYKHVAGQLLGFVGVDGNGLEGLEHSFNDYLSSVSTKQFVMRDASGRRFYINNGEEIHNSTRELQLTIDLQIQSIAEDAIAQAVSEVGAKWGGVLIVDVKSSEILAWSQYPFFNPNAYRQYKPSEYRNRLALDAFEPGSTFKPFLIAAALQEGIVTKDTLFNCENGVWKIKNVVIRDDGTPQKELSVTKILSHSSNIGCGKISLELGSQKFYYYLAKLGFGQPTGLNIIENKGILRRPREWSEADLISTAFGQSLSTNALQLTQGFLTIATHGIYKPISLFKTPLKKASEQRIFSEDISNEVLTMMRQVVESGTGKRAAISGVSIAGKTGTAQKVDKTGKYGQERIASFVGLFPAEDPHYLIMVVIDEPITKKYGGVIAAPVFRKIATKVMAYVGSPENLQYQVVTKEEEKISSNKVSSLVITNKKEKNCSNTLEVRQKIDRKDPIEYATSLKIPDVVGKSIRKAIELFAVQGLVPEVKGNGIVVIKQEPEAGTHLIKQRLLDKKCILWVSEK